MGTCFLTLLARGLSLYVIYKDSPALKKYTKTYNIGIQMNQNELTKTFMMTLNLRNPRCPWFKQKKSGL